MLDTLLDLNLDCTLFFTLRQWKRQDIVTCGELTFFQSEIEIEIQHVKLDENNLLYNNNHHNEQKHPFKIQHCL